MRKPFLPGINKLASSHRSLSLCKEIKGRTKRQPFGKRILAWVVVLVLEFLLQLFVVLVVKAAVLLVGMHVEDVQVRVRTGMMELSLIVSFKTCCK